MVFSVVDAFLLRPVPFTEPNRLAEVWMWSERGGGPAQPAEMLPHWRAQTQLFEQVEAHWGSPFTWSGPEGPETVWGSQVTVDLFSFLGATVQQGRLFAAGESDAPVAILSHGLWVGRFGGDPATVGRTIRLNERPHTIIGIMPAEFRFPVGQVKVWVPFDPLRPNPLSPRAAVTPIVRLREDVTLQQADEQVSVLAPQLNPRLAAQATIGMTARLQTLNRFSAAGLSGDAWFVAKPRRALLLVLGAAGLVLLAACANAANLFLSRALTRRRELAVRAALGVGRWRLFRSLMVEAVLVTLLAAAGGVGLAHLALQWLVSIIPGRFLETSLNPLNLDGRAVVWLGLASLVAGLVAACVPALRATSGDIVAPLADRGDRLGRKRGVSRGLLVSLEASVAVVLVIGAGLTARSLWSLTQADLGWSGDQVVVVAPQFGGERYRTRANRWAFMAAARRQLQTLPGLGGVGLAEGLPSGREGSISFGVLESETNTIPDAEATLNRVSLNYFDLLGIPVDGSALDESWDDGTRPAVVSRALADRLWPGTDPMGRRVRLPDGWGLEEWMTVVGVAGDIRTLPSENPRDPLEIYQPIPTEAVDFEIRYLVIRSNGQPGLLAAVRDRVQAVDPALPLRVRPIRELYAGGRSEPVFHAALFAGLAGLALVLAGAGISAVVSYDVRRQTRALGIRLALGASRTTLLRGVMARSVLFAGAGILIGAGVSLAAGPLMASMVYEIQPTDPLTFVAASLVLVGVAVLAAYVPARHATRIEPAVTLRAE